VRIPSGKIDQNIYFVALDLVDRTTRKTGLTSFTVYRSRNGGAATLYTTPTVTELSAANMPGVYSLLIDEDTTIAASSDSEEYVVHIMQANMLAVTRAIELYRRDTTSGNTLDVTATGAAGIDWNNVENPTTAVNLSATFIQGVNSLATGTDSVSTVATSGSTLTTGSATSGTYASTSEQDGVYWRIADAAGSLDMYFEFNVGSLGVPTTALWVGALTTAVNSLKVFAYNWGGSAWEQVGLLSGASTLIVNEQEYNFTTSHVGTGGNLGLVRLRFQNTGLVSANFYTDRILCSYTNVYSFPSNFGSLAIDASGRIDVGKWIGGSVPSPNVTGVPLIDLKYTLGTLSPATAGSVRADAVTARVTANTDQLAGQTVTAAAGVTFPSSVASPTNITAGTITTATNLTNAPSVGDFTAAMKTSLNAATPAVTVSDKTGFSLSAAGIQAIWDALTSALTTVGSIGKRLADNIDATISSRTKPADTQAAVTLVTTTTNVTNDVGITQAGADKVWASATRSLTTFGTLVADVATAVWGAVTRTLTAGTNIVLAKGVGVTGFNDLDAAGVRSAVGLASANLDTQLSTITSYVDTEVAAIKVVTDELATALEPDAGSPLRYRFTADALSETPTSGSCPTVAQIADGVWDEAIAGHLGAGSTGEALTGAGATGNPWITVLEGSLTASDLLRVTAGVVAGKDNIVDLGGGAATVTFRDAADTTTIVTATMAGSKRTAVVITP